MSESHALTPLQKSMVLATLRAPRSGAYVIQNIWDLTEPLDIELLQRAWKRVTERHPALRVCFETNPAGEFRQRVIEQPVFHWAVLQGDKTDALLRADQEQGFDFSQGTPSRFTVLRRSDRSYTLIWTSHHAMLDGASYEIVFREWFAIYDGLLHGMDVVPPAAPSFAEHLEWLDHQDLSGTERFWRASLSGAPEAAGSIVDRMRPPFRLDGHEYAKERVRLSERLTEQLRDLARRENVTINTLVQAAWALLLSRHNGVRDVVFGVTRSGRHTALPHTQGAVGLLINTVPFRVEAPPDAMLGPWLRTIRSAWTAMRDYEQAPLEKISEWSGHPAGSPFDSVLVYDHQPPGESLKNAHRTLTRLQRTDSPLTLAVCGSPVVTLDLIYDTQLFSKDLASGMTRRLATLLEGFVSQSASKLGAIRMLTADDEQWLARCQGPSVPHQDECIHRLVERQAQLSPSRIALEHRDGFVSYQELNSRANQLAWRLREQGIGAEDLVGVSMERSPEVVIAILAVLKAGAAFLPLDPKSGPERLATIIDDARPKLVLRDAREGIETQPTANLPDIATPANAAYAMYTSGSTGKPKAVVVTHGALVNHTLGARAVYGITGADRRLQFASIGSDIFVAEIFNYLTSGGTLVFCLDSRGNSVQEFLDLLDEHRITIAGMPSAWWHEWVATLSPDGVRLPRALRAVIAGAERVEPAALQKWKRIIGNRLRWFNAYGPTETTVLATIYEAGSSEWEGASAVPIGKPIANVTVHVLDADGHPAPAGIAGELYIGGAAVARGYRNAPELTAERFLPDPFAADPDARMYRTGDLGLRLPDGNLVFLGRMDRQVKIRGFRVEPEEIEAVLARHPAVRQCAVVAEQQRLIAYVTTTGDPATEMQLRRHVAHSLPDSMVPFAFVTLPSMPLLPNGKIDLRSLPGFEPSPLESRDSAQPSTETERRLAAIWQEALGRADLGIDDNFFDAGGDSLRATRLITLIRERFGREVPLAALWRAPSVATMASLLDESRDGFEADGIIALQPVGSSLPVFAISSHSGDPYCFRHLAAHLAPEQPFLVIPNPIRDGDPARTVEQLAEHACLAIRRVRPHGPYLLAGYCLGGVVAFESARQLMAAGEDVRLVAMFDTPAPGYPKLLRSRRRYWQQLRIALSGKAHLRQIGEHLGTVGRLLRNRAASRIQRAPTEPGTADVATLTILSARMYTPKPLDVPIAQFIARDDHVSTRILEDPRLGWRELSKRAFETCDVQAAHGTLFQESTAGAMAEQLRGLIRRASVNGRKVERAKA